MFSKQQNEPFRDPQQISWVLLLTSDKSGGPQSGEVSSFYIAGNRIDPKLPLWCACFEADFHELKDWLEPREIQEAGGFLLKPSRPRAEIG